MIAKFYNVNLDEIDQSYREIDIKIQIEMLRIGAMKQLENAFATVEQMRKDFDFF